MIEWPDLIVGLLPLCYVEIEIDKLTDTTRVLQLKKYN